MSKIFGELLMLIEKDYRGTKATMAYNGLSFAVPKNLYIIGMMNTADRSLAMMSGNKISVRTLDLNRDFSEIAAQLNAIVDEHFS